jgi:hypothetical protein
MQAFGLISNEGYSYDAFVSILKFDLLNVNVSSLIEVVILSAI